MRRRPPVLAVLLLAAGTLLASAAVAAPASAAQTQGLQYVALGDSYAAGFGLEVVPGTPSVASPPSPAAGCLENEANYPRQVAAALGMSLTDATCTGAVTANIVATPQVTSSDFGGGTAQPQSLALSAATQVVTVSIGGNDAGFSSIAENCITSTRNGPTIFSNSPNCQTYYQNNPTLNPATSIPTTVAANLAAAYATIRQAAPNARVFVVGYPSLMPDAANTPQPPATCFTSLFENNVSGAPRTNAVPFTDTDVPFIRSLEVLLNQTIAAAAADAGFTFIDNQSGSAANSVCPQTTTATPNATPYVNGVTLNVVNPPPVTVNGALHPNAAGVAFLTGQVVPAIAAAFPDPPPAPAPVPVLANSGLDAAPTIALVAASVLLMAAGAFTMVRSRRRTRPTPGARAAR